eukprot:COSAG05_NODE_929_length_6558_cov_3.005264_2_plen_45_part_00
MKRALRAFFRQLLQTEPMIARRPMETAAMEGQLASTQADNERVS